MADQAKVFQLLLALEPVRTEFIAQSRFEELRTTLSLTAAQMETPMMGTIRIAVEESTQPSQPLPTRCKIVEKIL